MSGSWEVVKKKHRGGENSKKNPNTQKKKNAEMPQAEQNVPIKESQTMFDAFLEQERRRLQQQQQQLNKQANNSVPKPKEANNQPKKKNADKKKSQAQPKVSSLEVAIASLNVDDIKSHFAMVEARFPDAPKIWLEDLVSYLNIKLDAELKDPCFLAKPVGYPASLLTKEIRKLYSDLIDKCSLKIIQHSYEACLLSMVQDTLKGINTIGYRIFLQFIGQKKPEVVLEAIPKYIDFLRTYQNRQNVCLSMLWAAMQAGNADLEIGIKVWSEVLCPMVGNKIYSKRVLDQLQEMLSNHTITKPDKSYIGFRELFPILDSVYNSHLPEHLVKLFQTLYASLKKLSYGRDPSTVLRNYFPSYLHRLEHSSKSDLKAEVLSSLVECLTKDKMSYSVWRQLYTKHLMQSSILISHLNDEWSNLPSTFPKKLMGETLSAFRVTNDELKGNGKASPDVERCMQSCNAVLTKMYAQRFPWLKVLFFAAVLVSSLLALDIQQNGSFKTSKTGQFMKDAGLLAMCEQAWGKITVYSGKSYKWLEVNVPVYTSWIQKNVAPYIKWFWDSLFALMVNFWDGTQGIRKWANTYIPPVLQVVSDNVPVYFRTLSKYVESLMVHVSKYSIAAYKAAEVYSSAVIAWLHKNVLTGSLSTQNLQKYAGNTVQAFQEYTVTTYNWISNFVAAVIYPGK